MTYKRVRDSRTGAHITVNEIQFESNKEHYAVLKSDATDVNGHPLPPSFPQRRKPTTEAVEAADTKE